MAFEVIFAHLKPCKLIEPSLNKAIYDLLPSIVLMKYNNYSKERDTLKVHIIFLKSCFACQSSPIINLSSKKTERFESLDQILRSSIKRGTCTV